MWIPPPRDSCDASSDWSRAPAPLRHPRQRRQLLKQLSPTLTPLPRVAVGRGCPSRRGVLLLAPPTRRVMRTHQASNPAPARTPPPHRQDPRPSSTSTSLSESGRRSSIGCCRQPCLLYTSPSPRDGLLSRMPS